MVASENIAVPVALRNDRRDRVELPIKGLQEEGGKLSKLLALTFASGKCPGCSRAEGESSVLMDHPTGVEAAAGTPTSAQSHAQPESEDAKDRLVDILGCLARICSETATLAEILGAYSASQLNAQAQGLKPNWT